MVRMLTGGDPYGSHRVIEPAGELTQPATRLDNDMSRIWDNEILIDAEILNVDSASFAQIERQAGGEERGIRDIILGTVAERGKQQNPVTGSGGMFIGTVAQVGDRLTDRDLRPGDRVVSLVSLSLTPLRIDEITRIKADVDQVFVRGQAILFASGVYCKMPDDIPPPLALAVLDVAGAPIQTARLVHEGDTVVIIGVTGKSGMLCAHEARKKIGPDGRLIGIGHSPHKVDRVRSLELCDDIALLDASDALGCCRTIRDLTSGNLADVVINCVNIPDTEMATVLMCRDGGTAYFFSMATSFTKAALGAEGVGKDVTMIIGNGYAKGHADVTLNILRESPKLRELYETLYC